MHQHFGGNFSDEEFRAYLDKQFPGMHAIALDLLLPDSGFFEAIRQNVNAHLPFDLATYWNQASVPTDGSLDAALLALVNKSETTLQFLDLDVGLNARAAKSIVGFRNGPDGMPGTTDDRRIGTVPELDNLPYVGSSSLSLLRKYAVEHPQ